MWNDVDLMEWLKTIGKCLRFQDMMVWLSFSYMLEKGHMSERSLIYKYAIKGLPLSSLKLDSEVILSWNYGVYLILQEEWDSWVDEFKGMNDYDIMMQLMSTENACPFQESGFRPYKLVCGYIWIKKF